MTFEEYRALPGINASFLKACSFGAYQGWKYLHESAFESDAMAFGTAVHCAFLEPEKYAANYAFAPKVDKRTKAGKETWEAFSKQHAGKTILDDGDYHKINAIVTKGYKIEALREALESFEKEKTLQWQMPEYGPMKARLDLLDAANRVIIDLKTTRDANPREFTNQMLSLRYDVQFRHYQEAVGPGTACYAVAIESESEEVALYDVTDIVESPFTTIRYQRALETAREVLAMKERPAKFKPEIVTLELPLWAQETA